MQQKVVTSADTNLALGWFWVAMHWIGLEHMQLEDLGDVLLAEVQVGV